MNALDPRPSTVDFPFSLPLFHPPRHRRFLLTFTPFTFHQPLQPHGLQFMPLGATLRHAYFH